MSDAAFAFICKVKKIFLFSQVILSNILDYDNSNLKKRTEIFEKKRNKKLHLIFFFEVFE